MSQTSAEEVKSNILSWEEDGLKAEEIFNLFFFFFQAEDGIRDRFT